MRKDSLPHSPDSICISIITQFYPPDFAATGQLIEELATRLSDRGVQVHVFTGQPGYAFQTESAPNREELNGVIVRRSRTSRLWAKRIRGKAFNSLIFCLRSALHLLKTGNHGDILLLTTAPPYLPILGFLANWLFGVPYICLLYDIYPDIAVELRVIHQSHWLIRLWKWLNCQAWKRSERLIVLSSNMKDRITAHCPEVADKITVIHNWADPNWIVPLDKKSNWFAKEYDLVQKFTVLYSGNMGRCHDLETILAAAELLRDEPIQFVFIGGGAKREVCIARAQALGLTNCRFLPYQDKDSLPYSLTACDLSLVSIGRGMEGLIAPSKLYGSLAAARPIAIICEPYSYLNQIVADAKCGKTFIHGEGDRLARFIRYLSHNPQVVTQMGNAGRRYLQRHFTPDIIAQQYLQVLRRSVQWQKSQADLQADLDAIDSTIETVKPVKS